MLSNGKASTKSNIDVIGNLTSTLGAFYPYQATTDSLTTNLGSHTYSAETQLVTGNSGASGGYNLHFSTSKITVGREANFASYNAGGKTALHFDSSVITIGSQWVMDSAGTFTVNPGKSTVRFNSIYTGTVYDNWPIKSKGKSFNNVHIVSSPTAKIMKPYDSLVCLGNFIDSSGKFFQNKKLLIADSICIVSQDSCVFDTTVICSTMVIVPDAKAIFSAGSSIYCYTCAGVDTTGWTGTLPTITYADSSCFSQYKKNTGWNPWRCWNPWVGW
jgi:hypothetical protein